MPGFSDEERERIEEALIENGRELLLKYGPEKTTVRDITEPTSSETRRLLAFVVEHFE